MEEGARQKRLWVPGAYGPPGELFICRVPIGPDEVCGDVFETNAELMRHLPRCIADHEQDMHEARLETRVPMLEHEDPEVEAHMRKVGQRMLAEGRWTVKDSEKAGF